MALTHMKSAGIQGRQPPGTTEFRAAMLFERRFEADRGCRLSRSVPDNNIKLDRKDRTR